MWTVERDPALTSSFLNITFLDREPDAEAFRRRMRRAVQGIPRLRQRIGAITGPWAPPAWEDDPRFDLGHHIREMTLGGSGTDREVLDFAAREYTEPFDPSRPLWRFTLVNGLQDGRAALLAKMHHTISDGVGAIRLSAQFTDVERHPDEPDDDPDVDDLSALKFRSDEPDDPSLADALVGAGKWAVGQAVHRVTHPQDLPGDAANAMETMRSLGRQLLVTEPSRSTLWAGKRSTARHFDALRAELEPAKVASKALGGTLNDFFVAAVAGGAGSYHRQRGAEVGDLRVSMPVSTRSDRSAGGNAFTPTRVLVPAGIEDPVERFREVHERLGQVKNERSLGFTDALAGAMRSLPTPVLMRLVRQQVDTVDFAASNTRGAPFDLFIGGAMVLSNHPMGPTGGTAFNATLMSYRDSLDIGLNVDPAAVEDPQQLRDCIDAALFELVKAGSRA